MSEIDGVDVDAITVNFHSEEDTPAFLLENEKMNNLIKDLRTRQKYCFEQLEQIHDETGETPSFHLENQKINDLISELRNCREDFMQVQKILDQNGITPPFLLENDKMNHLAKEYRRCREGCKLFEHLNRIYDENNDTKEKSLLELTQDGKEDVVDSCKAEMSQFVVGATALDSSKSEMSDCVAGATELDSSQSECVAGATGLDLSQSEMSEPVAGTSGGHYPKAHRSKPSKDDNDIARKFLQLEKLLGHGVHKEIAALMVKKQTLCRIQIVSKEDRKPVTPEFLKKAMGGLDVEDLLQSMGSGLTLEDAFVKAVRDITTAYFPDSDEEDEDKDKPQ